MGYVRHHAIVVTSWSGDHIRRAYEQAHAIFELRQVTPIVRGVVNDVRTFLVGPDGSKEGWSDSETGDARRAQFVAWLDAQRYEDGSSALRWVEVQYGDDRGETRVVRDSDERERLTAAP